jgi:hypothetical protein
VSRDKRWRPRAGVRLMEERSPGWIERTAVRHIGKLPKIFLYAPVALILAWLLTPSGRGELHLKSIGAIALAAWLAIDLWHALLKEKWRWRFVIGWTSTSLLFIGGMLVMYWWLAGILQDQRDDVMSNLVANYQLHDPQGSPLKTLFTITNNSHYALSTKNKLMCHVNHAVGNDGTSEQQYIWEGEKIDDRTGKWTGIFGGTSTTDTLWDILPTMPAARIEPGGDSTTAQCLTTIGFKDSTDCIDVTLIFLYTLDTQPNMRQEKYFRYVGTMDSNSFAWRRQPVESRTDYCQRFVKTP